MSISAGTEKSGWKLFWGERNPILLGLACGSILSTLFPLARTAVAAGWAWLSSPAHSDMNALPADLTP